MTKKELERAYDKLLFKASMMRLQLMTLAMDINSEASKKILAKLRRQIIAERENELSKEN